MVQMKVKTWKIYRYIKKKYSSTIQRQQSLLIFWCVSFSLSPMHVYTEMSQVLKQMDVFVYKYI